MLRIFFIILFFIPRIANCWGFFAHEKINRLAVFTLPPEMMGFYKKHIDYLGKNAVNPDKRRYAMKGEACRHYIDLDVYGDSAKFKLPKYWKQAVEKYTRDTLEAYGIVPWHIYLMKYQLTEAFKEKDIKNILRLSADLGHYIGDANVPLHTTQNYNGQLSNQHGIHGFWESRLPELFMEEYDFFIGPAKYLDDPQAAAWEAVYRAHSEVDSVLQFERNLNNKFTEDRKYSFEERAGVTVKVYSREYSESYHKILDHQVERQMKASVKMVGDIWYTCWVDAGQPDISKLSEEKIEEEKEISVDQNKSCEH